MPLIKIHYISLCRSTTWSLLQRCSVNNLFNVSYSNDEDWKPATTRLGVKTPTHQRSSLPKLLPSSADDAEQNPLYISVYVTTTVQYLPSLTFKVAETHNMVENRSQHQHLQTDDEVITMTTISMTTNISSSSSSLSKSTQQTNLIKTSHFISNCHLCHNFTQRCTTLMTRCTSQYTTEHWNTCQPITHHQVQE